MQKNKKFNFIDDINIIQGESRFNQSKRGSFNVQNNLPNYAQTSTNAKVQKYLKHPKIHLEKLSNHGQQELITLANATPSFNWQAEQSRQYYTLEQNMQRMQHGDRKILERQPNLVGDLLYHKKEVPDNQAEQLLAAFENHRNARQSRNSPQQKKSFELMNTFSPNRDQLRQLEKEAVNLLRSGDNSQNYSPVERHQSRLHPPKLPKLNLSPKQQTKHQTALDNYPSLNPSPMGFNADLKDHLSATNSKQKSQSRYTNKFISTRKQSNPNITRQSNLPVLSDDELIKIQQQFEHIESVMKPTSIQVDIGFPNTVQKRVTIKAPPTPDSPYFKRQKMINNIRRQSGVELKGNQWTKSKIKTILPVPPKTSLGHHLPECPNSSHLLSPRNDHLSDDNIFAGLGRDSNELKDAMPFIQQIKVPENYKQQIQKVPKTGLKDETQQRKSVFSKRSTNMNDVNPWENPLTIKQHKASILLREESTNDLYHVTNGTQTRKENYTFGQAQFETVYL